MKKNQTLKQGCAILIILLISFTACKKDAGEKGEQGLAGPAGSTILNGNGIPANTMGTVGDFYLDLATSNFYGPKKTEGWGNPFSMIGATGATGNTGASGATGANGAAGSQILSGPVTPAADLGTTGDYYLDRVTYNFYGPKTNSGWGVALNLRGTANVIYSGWNYARFFRDTTVDNSALRVGDLAAPVLTSALLNNASVQIYFTFGGGVFPLPYTSFAGGKVNTINFLPRVGRFTITRFAHDNTNSVALSTLLQYRYVIIPGGVATAHANEQKPDLSNYEAVQAFYQIGN